MRKSVYFLSFFGNKILFLFVLFAFVLLGCSPFVFSSHTYHRPQIVEKKRDFCIFGQNREYIYNDRGLYKMNDDSTFSRYFPLADQQGYICALSTNNQFIATSFFVEDSFPYVIVVFDMEFNIINRVSNQSKQIDSMLIVENDLFCLETCNDGAPNYNWHHELVKYSIPLLSREKLLDNFDENDIYCDAEVSIFLQKCEERYYLQNISEGAFYASHEKANVYDNSHGRINMVVDSNKLTVNYNQRDYSFDLPFSRSLFYNKIIINDDYMIFAISEYINNNDCFSRYSTERCVCHFGNSCLTKLDFKTNKLSIEKSYPFGSMLIDFNNDESFYYHEGLIYNDDGVCLDCLYKIETKDHMTIKGDNYSSGYADYYLLYHDINGFYCIKTWASVL